MRQKRRHGLYRRACPDRSLPESCRPARCLLLTGRSEKSAAGCCRAGRTHLRFVVVDLAMYLPILFRSVPDRASAANVRDTFPSFRCREGDMNSRDCPGRMFEPPGSFIRTTVPCCHPSPGPAQMGGGCPPSSAEGMPAGSASETEAGSYGTSDGRCPAAYVFFCMAAGRSGPKRGGRVIPCLKNKGGGGGGHPPPPIMQPGPPANPAYRTGPGEVRAHFADKKGCIPSRKIVKIMQYTIVLDPDDCGGFTARCVELPGTVCQGANKGEALDRLKEAIGQVQLAQQADLHRTIQSLTSEIIRIDVADAA